MLMPRYRLRVHQALTSGNSEELIVLMYFANNPLSWTHSNLVDAQVDSMLFRSYVYFV